ncbi:MAG: gamma-glutamyltransferase [Pseudomonadota bacterium]|nr:MAG: gamma-glutamyltransferase [Pseudomonadota bacterium]
MATAHPLATEAGFAVLDQGGNAFDAAVAVTAALAVVEPYSSGIGGGGFWLLHRSHDGYETMLDGRERAPLAAHRDLYLDDRGNVIPGLSVDGPLAAGIPGVPAALDHLARHYGRLPLAASLQPAIRLAREGFPIDEHYRRLAEFRLQPLRASPAAARQFLVDDEVPAAGYPLRQPELAQTLVTVAERGAAGFYSGDLAQRLVAGTRAAGGIWTQEDLADYRLVEREPIRGAYRGLRITAAAPPSSGGVVLVSILNQLAQFARAPLDSTITRHRLIETMRRAYRDRALYLGDPDFVTMPLRRLLSAGYAREMAATVVPDRATPSTGLPGVIPQAEGPHTTHFSIIDREGNRVAATLSVNYPFGSGFVPPGTGVLLNDEMDDFSAKPGIPNVYGLVGAEANAIAPGKRMLSSMTPAFVEGDGRVAILGTPGGSRIITMVLQGVLAFAEGERAEEIVTRPRLHHQYLPDVVQLEPDALSAAERQALQLLGHRLEVKERPWGNMQAVVWDRRSGEVEAASDPRGMGAAEVR